LGYRWSRVEFVAMLALAYVVPPVLVAVFGYPISTLLPLLSLPLAAGLTRTVLTRTDGEALNPALERTGQLLAAHSALFAIGLALT